MIVQFSMCLRERFGLVQCLSFVHAFVCFAVHPGNVLETCQIKERTCSLVVRARRLQSLLPGNSRAKEICVRSVRDRLCVNSLQCKRIDVIDKGE